MRGGFEPANVVWFPLMTLPVDQAPVQKRLRTSSVQFQDFRSIRAHNLSPSNKAVSLLSINRRIQMRQNNVDFKNRELRTNILARLLVTTRRVIPDDTQQHQEQTAIAPLNQCDGLVATRALVLRRCDFTDSSASPKMVA